MKRFISALLILATVLSCLSLNVSAEEYTVSEEGRLPFEDVGDGHWFYEAVKFCYANNVIKGMDRYTFDWNGNLTRAQFVAMLAGLEGVDTSGYKVNVFVDVKPDHWYYGAVSWAFTEGIVTGLSYEDFAPNKPILRSELAQIMNNYMKDKYEVEVDYTLLDAFTDKPRTGHWFYESVAYSVSAGLISGIKADDALYLKANGFTTRAQAAVIFHNFMDNYYFASCEHSFSEADCTNPSVCSGCGMVDGLALGHKLTSYNCESGGVCTLCGDVSGRGEHRATEPTCTEPGICKICGAVCGDPKGHKWTAATCIAPKTCTVCKAKEGITVGHNWWAATCTNPKMCKVCYKTEGNALGHSYSGNYCTRCGDLTPYAKASYYFKQKGDRYSKNSYVRWCVSYFGANGVVYNADTGDLGIFFGNYFDNGSFYVTVVYLPKTGTTCRFEYIQKSSSGSLVSHGIGYFDASTYKYGNKLAFTSYEGRESNYDTALSRVKGGVGEAINQNKSDFKKWCYVSLSEFGFVYVG